MPTSQGIGLSIIYNKYINNWYDDDDIKWKKLVMSLNTSTSSNIYVPS